MAKPTNDGDVPLKRTSWSRQINLDDALAGKPPPGPRVCSWTDSVDGHPVTRALFYPNEVHSVFGDPEALKSWLLLLASVQEVKLGHHVFYLDMEANDRSIVDRLRLLGATATQIKKLFHYFRPDDQINDADQARFRSTVQRHHPTLVVLDGVTEAFAVHGLSINSPEDTASWFRNFARQFQVKAGPGYDGPAIVELDHVVKNKEARGGWAIGSIHKKAGIKGAAYQVVAVAPLGKGKHGTSRLFLEKDSPGGVEWSAFGKDRRRLVATLHCDATDEMGFDAYLESPDAEADAGHEEVPLTETLAFRELAHRIWKYIGDNGPCSGRRVRDNNTGTNDRIASAIEFLHDGGYLRNEGKGNKQAWVVVEGRDFSPLRVQPARED